MYLFIFFLLPILPILLYVYLVKNNWKWLTEKSIILLSIISVLITFLVAYFCLNNLENVGLLNYIFLNFYSLNGEKILFPMFIMIISTWTLIYVVFFMRNFNTRAHKYYKNKIIDYFFGFIMSITLTICILIFLNNKINDDGLIVAIATFLIGVYVAVFGFLTSLEFNRRELNKQTAINRQKWVNTVRSSTTEFIELCSRINKDTFTENQAALSKLTYEILLLMNPNDFLYLAIYNTATDLKNTIEKKEISQLPECCLKCQNKTNPSIKNNIENHIFTVVLTELVQCLLKAEWERIKNILNLSYDIDKDYYSTEIYLDLIPDTLSNQTYSLVKTYLPKKDKNSNPYIIKNIKKMTDSVLLADKYSDEIEEILGRRKTT